MSDPDPQTRDLRAALRASEPGARKETSNIPPLVWIVLVVLVVLAAVAYFGWGRTVISPSGAQTPAVSSTTAAPASSS
jgi:flagellar basal body-associated protein FliL